MSSQEFNDPFDQFDDLDGIDSTVDSDIDLALDGDGGFGVQPGEGDDFGASEGFGQEDDQSELVMPSQVGGQYQSATPSESGQAGDAKPFLKTPLGLAAVGLGVVGLIAGAGIAVTSLGGNEEVADFSEVDQGLAPEPVSEPNFGQVVTPQPNQAAQLPISEPKAPAPVATPGIHVSPSFVEQPVVEQRPFASAPSGSSEETKEVLSLLKQQSEELKELKSAIRSIAADVAESKRQLQHNAQASQELRVQLSKLADKVEKGVTLKPVQAEAAQQTTAVTTAPAAQTAIQPAAVQQPALQQTAPQTATQNPAVQGRERVYDFQVIESSASGEMAIIKKISSGRVFTVFKGEVLIIGGTRYTVQGLAEKGTVVLVGDKLYIDKVAAPKPVAKAPAKSAARTQSTKKPAASNAARDAKGFTLNAVYDSDKSFGVVDNKGNFKSYRVGDSVPELGGAKVQGLDSNGNLRVGGYVIKSIYE